MKKYFNIPAILAVVLVIMICSGGCKKITYVESTTTDLNIYGYLKSNPQKYSAITAIVDKSGYAGFLNAYGSYTMFAPTDSAVNLYLTEVSKTLSTLTEAEAKDIVKFHLLEDTITTAAFKDGKLPTITMYGQFLTTAVVNESGISKVLVNRQGIITSGNIKTGNGIIHEINKVLRPASKSVAQLISADARFSIFTQALQATGYYDTINTINSTNPALRRWYTVLAETDQALRDSGITSFAVLKAKYSNTGNPLNPLDSLNIYIKYHIIPENKYLADIASANSHATLAPLEVLASSLTGEQVLINELTFNGILERGVPLERSTSDLSATTGVLHTALAHFAPKVRIPTAVYWDVADFPEVRRLPAVFRRANFFFAYGSIKDYTWNNTVNTMDYTFNSATNAPHVYRDYLQIPMGNTSRHNWIEFTTPLIIKGRYKVWICYRAAKQSGSVGVPGGSNMPVQASFNGVDLTRQFNFTEQRPNLSDGEMEALGWKRYTVSTQQNMTGKYLGIIDVTTTDRHKFTLRSLPAAGTGQTANFFDMVHFIPINDPQYLPRFDQDGNKVNL
jgi:uncharacterized surface protein with fasciclin (FAS1) repeats